jgi:hypothetical protein
MIHRIKRLPGFSNHGNLENPENPGSDNERNQGEPLFLY